MQLKHSFFWRTKDATQKTATQFVDNCRRVSFFQQSANVGKSIDERLFKTKKGLFANLKGGVFRDFNLQNMEYYPFFFA